MTLSIPLHARAVRAFSVAAIAAAIAGCSDSTAPTPASSECSTNITAANDGAWVELCQLDVPVRHVKIENARALATHASAQIIFGASTAPTTTSGSIATGQFRVLLYGGGPPGVSPILQASFGAIDASLDENASYINSGATVCFDLSDGSATTAPQFVLWVSGQRGADCNNRSSLTLASATGVRSSWKGSTGPISKQLKAYFRQAAGSGATPKITLTGQPVLDETTIAASTSCTTNWANNTDWQQLCTPVAGQARHIRIDAAQSTANNSYFYAVIGQDPSPTGNPAAATGRLIVTGGRSNSGTSWTWFRFGSGSTTQFSYATDAGSALYTQAASSICFDVGTNSNGTARIVFWATGAKGADCAVKSSLRVDRALYDSSTDSATGTMWNAPYVNGKLNFVKTSNANVTMGNVSISSEPAAL